MENVKPNSPTRAREVQYKAPRVRADYYSDKTILRWTFEEAAHFSGWTMKTLYNYSWQRKFKVYGAGMYRVDRVSFEILVASDKPDRRKKRRYVA